MRLYVLKSPEKEIFAEGALLSNGKCFISFIRDDYTFVYDNINALMKVHKCNDLNTLEFNDGDDEEL